MNGILNVYKEKEMTSHDVVAILRGVLKTRRIGHSGTLDPMATGVLPILIGKATRLSDQMTDMGKAYRLTMRFGTETDTLDVTGRVLKEGPEVVSESDLRGALSLFLGKTEQRPPMYSAVKVRGKKLYEYAREGIEVERPTRTITIDRLDLLSFDGTTAVIDCQCSKGTYIRQLIADVAENCGTVAVMTALERTAVGTLNVDDALSIDRLRQMQKEGVMSYLLPPDSAVSHFAAVHLSESDGFRAKNGQVLTLPTSVQTPSPVRVYANDVFMGIGERKMNRLHMKKVLV